MAVAERRHRPLDIVVFDLGGVLVRITRSWVEAHQRAGLETRDVLQDQAFAREQARINLAGMLGRLSSDEYCEAIAAASRGAYSPEEIVRISKASIIEEYPGVDLLVEAVEAAGLETGALSNTTAAHWHETRSGQSAARFPTVARIRHAHASHLLGLAKPELAIYRAFERETGLAGNRIVYFDDVEENVEAARSVNWHAETIDHSGDTAEQLHTHLRRLGLID